MTNSLPDANSESFYSLLRGHDMPEKIARGCALAKAVHEHRITRPEATYLFCSGGPEEPKIYFLMANEYANAFRKQIYETVASDPQNAKRRWPDYLESDDILKRDRDIQLGFDTYRAAQKNRNAPSPHLHLRKNNPPEFWNFVQTLDIISEDEKKKGGMTQEIISHWTHDINNSLVLIFQLECLEPINRKGKSQTMIIRDHVEHVARLLKNLTSFNFHDLMFFANQTFIPNVEALIAHLDPDDFRNDDINRLAQDAQASLAAFRQIILDFKNEYSGYEKYFEKASPAEYIDKVVQSMGRQYPDIEIIHNPLCPDHLALWINPTDLTRIFKNLVKNACEALNNIVDRQKKIEIASRLIHINEMSLANNDETSPFLAQLRENINAEAIEISIQDNGCGIPPEKRALLFRKSFTTKSDGHGLGLRSVNALVHSYGGTIEWAPATHGQGTRFLLYLPIRTFDSNPRNPQLTSRVAH
jgi:signal transduction histidine kinase